MDSAFDHLEALAAGEPRAALATLVATRDTSSKQAGARMWVGATGRVLGAVTLGGCVDARVLQEAEEVMASGRPRLLSITLGDEEAWDFGLTCGGTLDVLLEPVEPGRPNDPVVAAARAVEEEVRLGRSVVTVSPLEGAAVARLVVRADGTALGTLGDAALDAEAAAHALALLPRGRSHTRVLGTEAGRPVSTFFEVHAPPATLLVIGAGPVAVPLARIAAVLGLRTVVVDGRERLATRERFPDADEIRVGRLDDLVPDLPLGPATLVVLVAHDYRYDLPALRAVLRGDAAYVGLLGSRRRGAALLGFLAQEGVAPEALARVRVPVGLDIGARTPAEIALAVLAEALAVRSARPGAPLREESGR